MKHTNYLLSLFAVCICWLSFGALAQAQPGNDDCLGAIPLTLEAGACTSPIDGPDIATATYSGLGVCTSGGGGAALDVWYSATIPAGGELTFETSGDLDSVIEVFTGPDCSNLTAGACNDDGGVGSSSLLAVTGAPGDVVYVRVWEFSNDENETWGICAYGPPPPPANDECIDAVPLSPGVGSCDAPTTGSFLTAASYSGLGACTSGSGDAALDVWYSTTIPAAGEVTIETGGSLDSVMEAFTGPDCANLTAVDCNDDGGVGTSSLIVVTGAAGDLVYVRVWEFGNDEDEAWDICAYEPAPPPANDECIAATSLTHEFACNPVAGSIAGATDSGIAACAGSNANDDVWFSFVADGTDATITMDDDFDGVVELFSGACATPTSIGCSDPGTIDATGLLTDGETYFVRVHNYAAGPTSTPDFTLCISGAPAACTNPTVAFSTACIDDNNFEVIVDLTVLGSASGYTISDDQGTATAAAAAVGMYNYGSYPNGTNVVVTLADDDDVNCNQVSASLTDDCTPPPANDECINAVVLPVDVDACVTPTAGSNVGSATYSGEGSCATGSGASAQDVWYSTTIPAAGQVTIETSGDLDSVMEVFTGPDCANLTAGDCNDDGGANTSSLVTVTGTPGDIVYVRIWEWGNDENETWGICAYGPPDPACTIPTVAFSASCIDDNTFAIDVDLSVLGNASSYSITDDQGTTAVTGITATGITTFGSYANGTSVVITLNDADDVDCSVSNTITTDCTPPPANDECAAAEALTHSFNCETVAGTVAGATDSGLAAGSCFGTPNDDVWYSFVAAGSEATIELDDNFDGVLELYSGDCATPTLLNCDDFGVNPIIEATGLTEGDTYLVRVFNYASSTADDPTFTLCVYGAPPACTFATVSAEATCTSTTEYEVTVDLSVLGSASSYTITDDQGTAAQTVSATGVYTYATYTSGSTAPTITVTDDDDADCTQVFTITEPDCACFDVAPTNDSLCDALALTVDAACTGAPYSNECATAETNEPRGTCWTDVTSGVTQSVWFSFVAPASGDVSVSTDLPATLTDTHITVYETPDGDCTNLTGLIELGCSEDEGVFDPGNGFTFLSVIPSLTVTPGETYFVQVDGYGTQTGDFCIEVMQNGVPGCTDMTACNFDPSAGATIDDGSCLYDDCAGVCGGTVGEGDSCDDNDPTTTGDVYDANCVCSGSAVPGCTDMTACNFDPEAGATVDDGSCLYDDCAGVCGGTVGAGDACDDNDPTTTGDVYDANCVCSGSTVPGCTDMTACNFDPSAGATVDDGSCLYDDCNGVCGGTAGEGDACDDNDPTTANDVFDANCVCAGAQVPGCIDASACNFDPSAGATVDDGSCHYDDCNGVCGGTDVPGAPCDDMNADTTNDMLDAACNCTGIFVGEDCSDPVATNFSPLASGNTECVYEGCIDSAATNYNPLASIDDGSCVYANCTIDGSIELISNEQGTITPYWYDAYEITVTGFTGPLDYDWERTGYVRVAADQDGVANVLAADGATFGLTITDANGCVYILEEDGFGSTSNNGTGIGGTTTTSVDVVLNGIVGETLSNSDGSINISITGGVGPYTYLWEGPGGFTSTSEDITGIESGHYHLTVTDEGTGEITNVSYWVPKDRRSGRLKTIDAMINLYPNPVVQASAVEFALNTAGEVRIELINSNGQLVKTLFIGEVEAHVSQITWIDASQLPAGMYLCRVNGPEGLEKVQKFSVVK